MMRSLLDFSKTGMEAQQTQLDTIAHNLANVGTNGLQARPRGVRGPDVPEPAPGRRQQLRADARCPPACRWAWARGRSRLSRNFAQGNLQQTSNTARSRGQAATASSRCRCPTAPWPTRATAAFQVNAQGQLVTNNGYTVQPGITIPANAQSVTIASDGTVGVLLPAQSAAADHRWPAAARERSSTRPASEPKGQNLFTETAASGTPNTARAGQNGGFGTLAQGYRRDLERQRGRGTGGDDPDAARLRDQLEGHPDLRPDAAAPGAAVRPHRP